MKQSIARTIGAGAVLTLLALTGCDQIDPLTRPYVWRPIGVNAMNIAAMAANPADLTHRRHSDGRRAQPDAESVERVIANKPTPLIGSGGGGGGGGGGGSAGGGN